jgi:preprotein translocase subunit SecF
MLKILKYRNFFLIFSGLLILASALIVVLVGFHLGIDFKSGSLWQIKIPQAQPADIRNFFASELGINELTLSFDAKSQTYSLTFREISDSERQLYLDKLKARFGQEVESLDFWTISPSISSELRKKAMLAIALVLVGISLYIAFAFRKVSRPISSWKYGLITLFTLVHDVAIPAAAFALISRFTGAPADTNFLVALLFVMGFSVHDTIVVFDRIRENLILFRDKMRLEEIVDRSLLQTLARSINTSLTLVVVLLAVYFLGPANIKFFILTILIGVIAGTYSSIFFASSLLVLAEKIRRRR